MYLVVIDRPTFLIDRPGSRISVDEVVIDEAGGCPSADPLAKALEIILDEMPVGEAFSSYAFAVASWNSGSGPVTSSSDQ